MGTSSSYSGPTGTPPLLPPWAPDPFPAPAPPDPQNPLAGPDGAPAPLVPLPLPQMPQPSQVAWQLPKAALSRLARGAAGASLATVARAYVRAHGGPRTAAAAAVQGRATTARLGGFLASGLQNGFVQAATSIGLAPYLGQDAESILAAFIDVLAPDGALLEDAAARTALIETSIELFESYSVADAGIAGLDAMDSEGVREIVCLSVTNYVNARLQEELVSRVERATLPENEANALMDQLRDFVASVVKLDLRDVDVIATDWNGSEGGAIVASIYAAGYTLLGDAQ